MDVSAAVTTNKALAGCGTAPSSLTWHGHSVHCKEPHSRDRTGSHPSVSTISHSPVRFESEDGRKPYIVAIAEDAMSDLATSPTSLSRRHALTFQTSDSGHKKLVTYGSTEERGLEDIPTPKGEDFESLGDCIVTNAVLKALSLDNPSEAEVKVTLAMSITETLDAIDDQGKICPYLQTDLLEIALIHFAKVSVCYAKPPKPEFSRSTIEKALKEGSFLPSAEGSR